MRRWLGASNRWLKSWTWWEMGMYISATRIWPPTPIGMPRRSLHRKRRPRSRTRLLVPRTRWPARPIRRTRPTARAAWRRCTRWAARSAWRWLAQRGRAFPSMAGGHGHEDPGQDLAGQEAEGRRRAATSRPKAGRPVPPPASSCRPREHVGTGSATGMFDRHLRARAGAGAGGGGSTPARRRGSGVAEPSRSGPAGRPPGAARAVRRAPLSAAALGSAPCSDRSITLPRYRPVAVARRRARSGRVGRCVKCVLVRIA